MPTKADKVTTEEFNQLKTRVDELETQFAELAVKKEEPPTKKGKAKKDKVDKADKPKRKPTGYLLFSKASRDEAKLKLSQNLEEGEKPSNPDIMRKLGEMWKELSEEEQQIWKDKAASDGEDVEDNDE